jgi:hypothetical protein
MNNVHKPVFINIGGKKGGKVVKSGKKVSIFARALDNSHEQPHRRI